MAWHIEGRRHGWIGEFFPTSAPVKRVALRATA
jgi:hypothetical protein